MSTIKDRNDKDLTETEEIKWQEYTELYKKVLMTQTITIVLSTHLDLGTLECEVKWAFGSITTNKASGSDGIPAKLFQILRDDAIQVLHSIYQQIWKIQQWLKQPDPLQEKSCVFYSPVYMTFEKTQNSGRRIKCCQGVGDHTDFQDDGTVHYDTRVVDIRPYAFVRPHTTTPGFPGGSDGKESASNAGS